MKIEVNQYNKGFVEAAREAGFTDAQIQFLSDWFAFQSELDD